MSRFHASRLPAATTALVHVALGGFNISLCGVASATRGGGGLRGKARHELESSSANLTATLTAFDLVVIDDEKKQGHDSRTGSTDSMSKSIVTSLEADAASFLELNAEKKENAKAQKLEMKHTANREEGDQVQQGQNGAIHWSSPGVLWLNDVEDILSPGVEAFRGQSLPTVSIDPQLKFTIWDDCKQVDQDCTVTTTPPPGGQPPATQNATKGRCAAYYGYQTNSGNNWMNPGDTVYHATAEQHGELWCEALPNTVLFPGRDEKQKPAVANSKKEPEGPKQKEQDQEEKGSDGSTPAPEVLGPWLHADKEATTIDPKLKWTVWDYCKQIGQACTTNTTLTTPPSGYDGVTPPATTPPDAERGRCVAYAGYLTDGANEQNEWHPTAQIHGSLYCESNGALLAAEGKKQKDEGETRNADGIGKTDDEKGESDALLAEEGTKQKGEGKTPNANGIGKPDAKEKADDKKGAATRVGISVVALLLPMGLTAAAILQ